MKANHLRIGNLIEQGEYGVSPITSYQLHNLKTKEQGGYAAEYYNNFKPIPLTEEWLLKFGFKKEEGTPTKNHGNYFSMWVMDYKYSFSYAPFREDWGFYHSYTDAPDPKEDNRFDFISCGIKYVHQLQNLYFALTGEELDIKDSFPLDS